MAPRRSTSDLHTAGARDVAGGEDDVGSVVSLGGGAREGNVVVSRSSLCGSCIRPSPVSAPCPFFGSSGALSCCTSDSGDTSDISAWTFSAAALTPAGLRDRAAVS